MRGADTTYIISTQNLGLWPSSPMAGAEPTPVRPFRIRFDSLLCPLKRNSRYGRAANENFDSPEIRYGPSPGPIDTTRAELGLQTMQLTQPSGAQGQLQFPSTSGGRERYSLLYRHTGKSLVAHRHAHAQGITGSSPFLREGTYTVTPQYISMKWPFLRA